MLVRGIAKEEGQGNPRELRWTRLDRRGGMGARLMQTSLTQEYIDKTLKIIPLRKFGEPADIANAVVLDLGQSEVHHRTNDRRRWWDADLIRCTGPDFRGSIRPQ
jgi:hypothetical protein